MSRIILFFFIFTAIGFVQAQNFKSDSSFLADAKKNSIQLYSKSLSAQSHLYNGSSYTEYRSQNEENPYFIDEWLDGTIQYDSDFYENVPLLYDISRDKLITDHQYTVNKIELINERIGYFTIKDHLFVQLEDKRLTKGFYELVYDGLSKVYVRHQKTLQSKRVDYSIENLFEEKTTYYILKDGRYISVKSKGSVLNVLEDKKTELKKFIRDNHLSFTSARTKDITRLVQYYDQLKN
ncbi:MAG TPA: hypothetical protein VIT44_12395 [Cyclobacteriaceae bacterium]